MYEKLSECPVCNSTNIQNHQVILDQSISKESFAIMKCKSCNFQFTNPRPSTKVIDKYYRSEEYISHTDKANSIINILYKIARKFAIRSKRKLINKIAKQKKGNILDYGCGTGYFLNEMMKDGWKIAGVEPNNQAREIANQLNNQSIAASLSELKLKNQKFNIITLWHVLEHLHDLNDMIKKLKDILKEKGKIIIAVPNIDSYDQQIFGLNWAAYDVPRHLYHFDQDTMKTLMLKHGLIIKKVYPLKLDSYYISLLSNKYKTGRNKYLNSIINGYKSNSYANKNNNNYSSLIYEIKK